MRKPDVDFAALDRLLARVFGRDRPLAYRRTEIGVSTQVYRLRRDGTTFYVRIAEQAAASLAPELAVHRRLRAAGVRVPGIVHFEPYDEGLERSVMVTEEVPGGPVEETTPPAEVAAIYRAAGRDLARVHELRVRGFDWVRREHDRPGWPLRGERPTYREYVRPDAVGPLAGAGFATGEVHRVGRLLAELVEAGPAGCEGRLAHGDFDTTHVFGRNGRYTGIIDFGEIRGTDYTFDFATLFLQTDKPPAAGAYPHLEEGYAELSPLPADHRRRLYLACVLSTTHRLCLMRTRDGDAAERSWFFRWLRGRLRHLLDHESRCSIP